MHFSLRLCYYVVALTCFFNVVRGRKNTKSKVTIDAAYVIKAPNGASLLYLFAGKEFRLLKYRNQIALDKTDSLNIPDDLKLQAAFVKDPFSPNAKYYYGDKFGYLLFVANNKSIATRKLSYGPKRAFIRRGGPDAAGRRNGVVYFFKGCKMAIRHKWYKWKIAQNDVKTIGLPCNVDAAWGESFNASAGAMVVLKGRQFWRWESDGRVQGPFDFHHYFTLDDWDLNPSVEE